MRVRRVGVRRASDLPLGVSETGPTSLYYAPPEDELTERACCLDAPEADEAVAEQARGSLRRLAVAMGLAIMIAFLCWVLAPRWGVHLPMVVPLMGFVAIAVGTIMAAAEAAPKAKPRQEAPGRPMCCSGPRPVGERMRMMNDER